MRALRVLGLLSALAWLLLVFATVALGFSWTEPRVMLGQCPALVVGCGLWLASYSKHEPSREIESEGEEEDAWAKLCADAGVRL